MYIHLGNNAVLKKKKIIGIFDMDTSTKGTQTRSYLRRAEKEQRTVLTSYEIPKAFVVTEENKIYYSQLSTSSLHGRLNKKNEV
ncbi:MAG: DUF370 domain-containing protein [Ruminococcaceae bacterium]|nr:DUF370 domain-containing protein [Oscillospiraceae bacterium]